MPSDPVPESAVERRDLRRWASSCPPVRPTRTGFIATYCMYASFFRIRPPRISSFLTGPARIVFINRLIEQARPFWIKPIERPGRFVYICPTGLPIASCERA